MGTTQSKSSATKGKVVPAAYILGIIDVQNDFCKDGALEVADAEAIVAPINKFRFAYAQEMPTFLTQDYHPENHMSFSTTHGKNPHETITYNAIMHNGDAITTNQILWPKHCVVGTEGVDFHRDLIVIKSDIIIQKGQNAKVESYSAFGDEMGNKYEKTPLQDILKSKHITDIVLVGLATDYCVYNTALDAIRLGYHVHLILSCTRGVAKTSTEAAMKDLLRKGMNVYETVDEKSFEFVKQIVQRGNERVRNGGRLLPTFVQKKNRITHESEQEYRDATKIGQLRIALDGKNRANCSDEVRDYLDLNMPGWRSKKRNVIESVQQFSLPVLSQEALSVHKKSHVMPMTTNTNENNTPSIACSPDHKSRAKSEYQQIGQRWATQNSKNTHEHLQSNPAEWYAYHAARDISFEGYDPEQIPRKRVISYLEQQYKSRKMRVLDMGCGRGNIYQHFNQSKNQTHKLNIIGYDHVAEEGKNIRVGNILDLSGEEEDESADVCIYSQSLMGADKLKYLDEGYRILRHNGEFVISESSGMLDTVKTKLADLACMVVKEENTVNEETEEQDRWFLLVAIKR